MDNTAIIGVVGAGTMGAGIAQVAATSGHTVYVFDARPGAADEAKTRMTEALNGLVSKGKMEAAIRDGILARVIPVTALAGLKPAQLVIEAIIEDLSIKRGLFTELENICGEQTIFASNTSSISITAIAKDLQRPSRFAGMHFFNPAPIMKLVEIISGLATASATANTLFALAGSWGKTAVHARSTPGFIVNRIARPFYAEALWLLQERRAKPEIIDACLRAAGFRMGPCELMDLIGHDVNFAVTHSVFDANFGDRRYVPSLVQRELVDGGLLGRKSGLGFYDYTNGVMRHEPQPVTYAPLESAITVLGSDGFSDTLARALPHAHRLGEGDAGLQIGSLRLLLTDGRTANERAHALGLQEFGVFDLPLGEKPAALAAAFAPTCSPQTRAQALSALNAAGFTPYEIGDAPGLIVARTIAMLVNEAADAVQQGVCDEPATDTAMKLGVNYPNGPFEYLARLGAPAIIRILDAVWEQTRSERYRVSPYLLARKWGGA